jgi:hypothetical protein
MEPSQFRYQHPNHPTAQTPKFPVESPALRASYNGYYPSFPSWRRGFDSHRPLHIGSSLPHAPKEALLRIPRRHSGLP